VSHWDASTYDRISDPLVELARPVVDRLELTGEEWVLDAGCGSGRVTELLCERAAGVVAVDADPEMVLAARGRLQGRARVLQRDLTWMEFEEPFDAILSTATLHWIPDHDTVFERFAAALHPGGRLSLQCGGAGNLAGVLAAAGVAPHWNFAAAEETEERLRAHGFEQIVCWLEPAPVTPDDLKTYLETIVFRAYEDPAGLARRVHDPTLDYVRLNAVAVRA
jgi:trans-aconitate 2-methyltransferase